MSHATPHPAADPAGGPEPAYPHGTHPGLVPGIGVDENRHRFGVDPVVFGVTAVLVLAFVVWGISSPASVGAASSAAFSWAMTTTGWLLNAVAGLSVVAMLVIGLSRFGRIRLGRDDEGPEFSRFSWVAMMFGAGIGMGIFFYGPSEPLSHYLSPPPHTVPAGTPEALHQAMAQSHFHWGLSAWAMYALVGGAIAYSSYRRGRVTLISSVFRSLFGARHTGGLAGRIVDMFAIVATVFGTAATLGLAAIQIGQGIQIVTGAGEVTNALLIGIIAVLTVAFVVSAVSGVSRGIRYLSNTNIVLTLGMVLFVFVAGPTLFLLNLIPSGVLAYADGFLDMMGRSLSWGASTVEFQSWWTAFYWAWWIAWTPFVGVFLARISRGRTLREFVFVVMAVPTAILVLAFTVLGGTSIWLSRQDTPGFDGTLSPQAQLFALFDLMPLSGITPVIVMVILAIFFVTSADSAAVVMGTLSSRGDPSPRRAVIAFWGVMMMGIAVVMLLAGGEDTLSALQNLTILIALPFSVVLLLMIAAFFQDLATDPASIRGDYAATALSNAARRGIEQYGDDFEIAVRRAPAGRGAGAEFDSTAPQVTDWYRRTDEDGNPVDYDYVLGEYLDEGDGDGADGPAGAGPSGR